MTKAHKIYELSKELVYQITGKYTEDVQDADFQISFTFLSKAFDEGCKLGCQEGYQEGSSDY